MAPVLPGFTNSLVMVNIFGGDIVPEDWSCATAETIAASANAAAQSHTKLFMVNLLSFQSENIRAR
jgi:hypothetical protein